VIETTAVNGIPLICETLPFFRSVSFGIWVNSGSRDETEEKSGLFHFLEHMVFKGTERRNPRGINMETDELGGQLDAFTSREATCYSCHVVAEKLEQAFDLVTDIMMNSVFPAQEMERERQVIIEEIRMGEDNPAEYIYDKMYPLRWPGHPLGRLITGSVETVASIKREDFFEARDKFYRPPRLLITACGAVEIGTLKKLAEKYFGGLSAGEPEPARKLDAPRTSKASYIMKKKLEQAHILLAAPGIPSGSRRRPALSILNTAFGGGVSSRLFQKVREEMGLAYSINSFYEQFEETGLFGVYAACSPDALPKLWDAVKGEIRRVLDNPPGPDEIDRAKNLSLGALKMSFESVNSRMYQMAYQWLYYGKALGQEEMLREVEGVTIEQVHELARELLSGEDFTVIALGQIHKRQEKMFGW